MRTLRDKLLSLPYYILPHHLISWCMLKLSRIENVSAKNFIIDSYTRLIDVDMSEALIEDKYAYANLNAFFTRELKPECRPFDKEESNWVCPVDGKVSQSRAIEDGRIFQAKGRDYSLEELLGRDEAARYFINGNFATLYLSPRDYHRIHMPVSGTLTKMLYIPGRLFSVAEHTVNAIPNLFARNERCVCLFDTDDGPMAMILVGAINVSAIETVWHGVVKSEDKSIRTINYEDDPIKLKRGEEMGRFNLGSTVIILTSKDFRFDSAIESGNTVKLGQTLGTTLAD